MRIAIVYDAIYPYVTGGAERRYYEIGRRLAARGHDVTFVGWRWWDGAPVVRRDDGTWVHGVGTPPSLHDGEGRRTFREALAFAARVVPAVARIDADVIECSSIPYLPALALAPRAKARHIPLVVSWHEYMGTRWSTYAPGRARVAAAVERQAARAGDLRVAVSRFTLERLPGGPRAIVVPNGVDVAASTTVRAERLADVVVAGRLVPHKRVHLLLQALLHAPGITAAVIGDGPERERLEAFAVRLGVADRVQFLGRVDPDARVAALVKGARCALVASEQEGFGMTVIEAMAVGTVPVVVRSEHSAAAELLTHGRDGYVVDADSRAIAAAIGEIVGDRDLRRRLGRAARGTSRGYDWDAIARQMEVAFADVSGARLVASEPLVAPLAEERAA